jgi:ADP-ribose pyrophosphatase YjhB (NUDIX family)
MGQRYLVFLNERSILIGENLIKYKNDSDGIDIDYTDKGALSQVYRRFSENPDSTKLRINAARNFADACKDFNSMFSRIEAAGGIVRNREGDYLFIKRLGVWDLPKGKLDNNESAQEAAIREVTEETGLKDLRISKQLFSTFRIYTDREGTGILKQTYWFEMMNNTPQPLVPQLDEDITEVRWIRKNELEIPSNNTYASLQNLLKEYLKS